MKKIRLISDINQTMLNDVDECYLRFVAISDTEYALIDNDSLDEVSANIENGGKAHEAGAELSLYSSKDIGSMEIKFNEQSKYTDRDKKRICAILMYTLGVHLLKEENEQKGGSCGGCKCENGGCHE